MAGFDVLLSLSDAEGLPLNLIEAGWAATPVFATRVGGVADLVDGLSSRPAAGALVDAGDSAEGMADRLAGLLGDAPRRTALGAELQARVRDRFSRRAWLTRLEELYAPYL
jgi:glycosyltransferase involved in cell wall biosynthesis